MPAWHGIAENDVARLATMLSHATFNIHNSLLLLVKPSGLELALACQGNLSLHDAAISEPIFKLLESQQWIETARKDTRSKGRHPLWKRFKLKSTVQKALTSMVNFGEVQRAQVFKSTIFTSTLEPLGSFQIF